MKWNPLFSQRVSAIEDSDVVKIMRLAERPEIISLAGGFPDPAIFLMDELKDVVTEVLTNEGSKAFGYSATAGLTPFREFLAEYTSDMGRPTNAEEIVVTTGGVAAIDLIAKVLVDPGDVIIVGEPTYLAALHVFRSYQASFVGVPVDEKGLNPEALENVLSDLKRQSIRPKLIYTVPSFQNPAGVTIPEERRRRIVAQAAKYGVPILEDAAYRAIRFEGDAPPMMAELDPQNVILVNTLSKVLNPGMRLGWIAAPKLITDVLVLAKQGQDQCSSTIGQSIALRMGERGLITKQTNVAIESYRRKRDVTLAALEKTMPDQIRWVRPEGGFYTWLTLPEGVDTTQELDRIVEEESVAYVPGSAFHHAREARNHLRLSYSFVADNTIEEGIARIARFFTRRLNREAPSQARVQGQVSATVNVSSR